MKTLGYFFTYYHMPSALFDTIDACEDAATLALVNDREFATIYQVLQSPINPSNIIIKYRSKIQ